MRCKVEITDNAPREDYSRQVSYRNSTEPGESRQLCPVKVTGIQAQRKIWTGGEVPVYITLANYVNHEKIAKVILQDYTNNVLIGEKEVVLSPLASKTLTFSWKTGGFSLGEHVLHAEAIADPEPYYEHGSMYTGRTERTRVDSDVSYPRRRHGGELQEIVYEAEEILRRVEQEWEDASAAHERATDEAERIVAEADEQAREKIRKTHVEAEGEAQEILDGAYEQVDGLIYDAETVRKQADEYRHQVESEAEAKAEAMWEQVIAQAEGEALEIKNNALAYAEELLAEVQKQLEAAKALRKLARDLADIAEDGAERSDCDMPADEPVAETRDEVEQAPVWSQAEAEAIPEPESGKDTHRRLNLRWYHSVIALALIAAAVMLSVGLNYLG
jgi:vacuolar-type H+-ATPase subunit H